MAKIPSYESESVCIKNLTNNIRHVYVYRLYISSTLFCNGIIVTIFMKTKYSKDFRYRYVKKLQQSMGKWKKGGGESNLITDYYYSSKTI